MHVTVDVAKLMDDLAALDADVESCRERVQDAAHALQSAQARRGELKAFIERLGTYLQQDRDNGVPGTTTDIITSTALPTRPLAGKTGTKAAELYVAQNPGVVERFGESFENMRKLGFQGTINSVQVAFSEMVRDGKITRPKKGTYRFPADTDVAEDEGGSVVLFPQAAPAERHDEPSAEDG